MGASAAPSPAPVAAGVLGAPAAPVSTEVLARVLENAYGLEGRLSPLGGERDSNFRLSTGGGDYVVKVTHPDEPPAAIEAQTAVLAHLAATDPTLPVQRIVPTRDGRTHLPFDPEARRFLRVVEHRPGRLAREHVATPMLGAALGDIAARIAIALAAFDHPGVEQALLWDITHAQQLRPLLEQHTDPPLRARLERALARHAGWEADYATRPRQAIHNDLNPSNVLVDEAGHGVTGILDFGDMVHAPVVADVAVATAYLTDARDPLATIEAFVRAYHHARPLDRRSLAMLPDLIATRHAMTVLITAWRAKAQPENAAYILRNQPTARRGLELLDGPARLTLTERLAELAP